MKAVATRSEKAVKAARRDATRWLMRDGIGAAQTRIVTGIRRSQREWRKSVCGIICVDGAAMHDDGVTGSGQNER
jgi:hypothetical protein